MKWTKARRAAQSRRLKAAHARRRAAVVDDSLAKSASEVARYAGALGIVVDPIDIRAIVRERVQAEIRAAVREVLGE